MTKLSNDYITLPITLPVPMQTLDDLEDDDDGLDDFDEYDEENEDYITDSLEEEEAVYKEEEWTED